MSDNEDDEQTVACPICGEYEGEVSSVKSHITGTGTGEHEGKSGGQYDELLRRRAGQLDESAETDDDPESSVEQATEADESAGSEATTNSDQDDDMPTDDEYQQQQEGEPAVEETEADENDEPDEPETNDSTAEQAAAATGAVGYLTGINPLVVVALAVGVLLLFTLATAESDESGSQKAQTEGDDEPETSSVEQPVEQTGGLN